MKYFYFINISLEKVNFKQYLLKTPHISKEKFQILKEQIREKRDHSYGTGGEKQEN